MDGSASFCDKRGLVLAVGNHAMAEHCHTLPGSCEKLVETPMWGHKSIMNDDDERKHHSQRAGQAPELESCRVGRFFRPPRLIAPPTASLPSRIHHSSKTIMVDN